MVMNGDIILSGDRITLFHSTVSRVSTNANKEIAIKLLPRLKQVTRKEMLPMSLSTSEIS